MLVNLYIFARKILPLCKIVSNINSIYGPLYGVFVFESFFFFQFFNGIFCGDTTKISFVDRQFFKASASFPPVDWGNWLVLIYFYCLLTNHSFLFSEKFSFCFLLFASCFLVFALYLALLSANQTQHNFWDVYYKRKIKSCRIFAPTSFKDAEFLHF